MIRNRIPIILLFIFILNTNTYSQNNYFYKGYEYGSQAMYNPFSTLVNAGFDVLQLGDRKDVRKVYFAAGMKNVFNNLKDPFSTINKYGWENFINDEIFPFSFNIENMQFWPNYSLHLIGGGMTYAALSEWYRYHNFPAPELLGATSFFAIGLVNEMVENGNYQGPNVDPISDVYLFNIAGVLLFSSDAVRKFFSEKLNLADWSNQPTFLFRTSELHNVGQYFTIKWKLPFSEKLHLFYLFGTNGLIGLSYKYEDNTALSIGIGARASDLVIVDPNTNKKTVNLNGTVGFYYDKNNSLLASLIINFNSEAMKFKPSRLNQYLANLNIYPGLLKIGSFSPGIWTALKRDGNVVFGLTLNILPVGIAQSIK